MTINILKTYIYKANFLNYTKKIENFPLKYNSYNSSFFSHSNKLKITNWISS